MNIQLYVQAFTLKSPHDFKISSIKKVKSFQKLRFVRPSMSLEASTSFIQNIQNSWTAATTIPISDETVEVIGYSNLSLYFTLALYIFTLPGLFSLITRSVKVKEIQKAYDVPGPANPSAKSLKQTAGEIMAYFKALNYEPTIAEDTITFKGIMGRSNSQAAFLTFCTFVGLASMALVLSILLPDVGGKAYLITLVSPYAGIYYWNNAQREDTVIVKMETSDDEQITSILCQGGKEDLERFSKTLQLPERGKIYVKGIFDDSSVDSSIIIPTSSAIGVTSTTTSVAKETTNSSD